jgi:hypothetical protein
MILPGLISIAFYRRRPSALQISLGLVFTVAVSALLGYVQDVGTSRVWENVTVAIVGGVILYVAILAYLILRYFPRRATAGKLQAAPPPAPPP